MAFTGLILVGFVAGHLLGNLQVFFPPEAINAYGYFLHNILPWEFLWGFRVFLVSAVAVHVWMAVLLTLENREARPETYSVKQVIQSTLGSRTMRLTGVVLLAFIVFHILHYTAQVIDPAYRSLEYRLGDNVGHDVYGMMILGFANPLFSVFYIIAMALLCLHLTHGVSSMFQSLGLRNKLWHKRLDRVAVAYGAFIFLVLPPFPLPSSSAGMAALISCRLRSCARPWRPGTGKARFSFNTTRERHCTQTPTDWNAILHTIPTHNFFKYES